MLRVTAMLGVLVVAAVAAAAPVRLSLAPAGEPGEHLLVTLTLRGPAPGAYELHAYQTDASGRYTLEHPMDEPHARLNARVDLAAFPATVELATIRPGGYRRWVRLGDRDRHIPAHVHLDVLQAGRVLEHWQMVFADDTLLSDPYWRDWVAKLHQPVVTVVQRDGVWRGATTLQIGGAK